MVLIPYPPEWSREESAEILTLWEKFSRRTWIVCCLLVRDDDRQAAWKVTAAAGYLSIALVLLLFLETLSARPVAPVVQQRPVKTETPPPQVPEVSTETLLDVPLVDVSYAVEMDRWAVPAEEPPVQPTPVKPPAPPQDFVDPFEQFSPTPADPEPPVLPPSFTPLCQFAFVQNCSWSRA